MEEEIEDFPMIFMIIYTLQFTRANFLAIATRHYFSFPSWWDPIKQKKTIKE